MNSDDKGFIMNTHMLNVKDENLPYFKKVIQSIPNGHDLYKFKKYEKGRGRLEGWTAIYADVPLEQLSAAKQAFWDAETAARTHEEARESMKFRPIPFNAIAWIWDEQKQMKMPQYAVVVGRHKTRLGVHLYTCPERGIHCTVKGNNHWVEMDDVELEPCGKPKFFYVWYDSKYVGNAMVWFKRGGGTTTDIREAKVFNEKEAAAHYQVADHNELCEHVVFEVSVIDNALNSQRLVIDGQYFSDDKQTHF